MADASDQLKELSERIGEMLTAYNRDLAYDQDDRIGAIQLIMTRPDERATYDKPSSVYITTKEFTPRIAEKEVAKVNQFTAGAATVTYSFSTSSNMACCAPGWVGIFDSQGYPHGCFPVAGPCDQYVGPLRCIVPG